MPAAVYVANIVEDEQPDWVAPEDPEADVETEDESHVPGKQSAAHDVDMLLGAVVAHSLRASQGPHPSQSASMCGGSAVLLACAAQAPSRVHAL